MRVPIRARIEKSEVVLVEHDVLLNETIAACLALVMIPASSYVSEEGAIVYDAPGGHSGYLQVVTVNPTEIQLRMLRLTGELRALVLEVSP